MASTKVRQKPKARKATARKGVLPAVTWDRVADFAACLPAHALTAVAMGLREGPEAVRDLSDVVEAVRLVAEGRGAAGQRAALLKSARAILMVRDEEESGSRFGGRMPIERGNARSAERGVALRRLVGYVDSFIPVMQRVLSTGRFSPRAQKVLSQSERRHWVADRVANLVPIVVSVGLRPSNPGATFDVRAATFEALTGGRLDVSAPRGRRKLVEWLLLGAGFAPKDAENDATNHA